MHRLAFLTAGAVLCHGLQTASAEVAWDCRASAAGGGWDCRATGEVPPKPPAPAPAKPEPAALPVTASPRATPTRESAETPLPVPVAAPAAAPPATAPTVAVSPQPVVVPAAEPLATPVVSPPQPAVPPASQSPPAVATWAPSPAPEPAAAIRAQPSAKASKAPASPKEVAGKPGASRPAAQAATADLPIGAPAIPVPSSIDDGLAWNYCGPPPPGTTSDRRDTAEASGDLVEAEADSAEGRLGEEVVTLSGDVRVRQGTDVLRADRADYDRAANVVDAQGNVLVVRPDLRVAGETARLDMAAEKGEITGAQYRLVGTNARGTAEVAHFRDRDKSDYRNVTYTTCRPGREDWVLKADELRIDRVEGIADAKDATLKLGDVPVAYLPTFSFPIDDRRRSGFLVPRLGFSDSRGVEFRVPYYFNLAPNYDATLTPGFLSKRGPVLGAEFRHMTDTSASQM
ncbi:MAG: hypothetical protein MUF66_14025, partial [Gammaproteobacteria bacterium]|nr:hypothetical protein [Gammaproteobacteria bacterium]